MIYSIGVHLWRMLRWRVNRKRQRCDVGNEEETIFSLYIHEHRAYGPVVIRRAVATGHSAWIRVSLGSRSRRAQAYKRVQATIYRNDEDEAQVEVKEGGRPRRKHAATPIFPGWKISVDLFFRLPIRLSTFEQI